MVKPREKPEAKGFEQLLRDMANVAALKKVPDGFYCTR